MALDPTTIEATQNPNQLSVEWIKYYKKFVVSFRKLLSAAWKDKMRHLEASLSYLTMAEAAIQKLRAKILMMTINIAQQTSSEIKRNPKENAAYLSKFSELRKLFEGLDRECAYEQAKADNTRRLVRGVLDEIYRSESNARGNVISFQDYQRRKEQADRQQQEALRLKAANDNLRQQQSKQ